MQIKNAPAIIIAIPKNLFNVSFSFKSQLEKTKVHIHVKAVKGYTVE